MYFKCLFFLFFTFFSTLVSAQLPQEELIFDSITKDASQIIVYRPSDQKKYIIQPGIGCYQALFDDLDQGIEIHFRKFSSLLADYGNGDIGIMTIKTKRYNTQCKIISVREYLKPRSLDVY